MTRRQSDRNQGCPRSPMVLSPLQAWRMCAFIYSAPPCEAGRVELLLNARPEARLDAQGREQAAGLRFYISVVIRQLDRIETEAHITILKERCCAGPRFTWMPRELTLLLEPSLRGQIQGISLNPSGSPWELVQRYAEPWRAILPIGGRLEASLVQLRAIAARSIGINVERCPPGGFHLSLDRIAALPSLADPVGPAA